MGCFKKVVRIAVPIATSFIPGAGAIAVAASSALTTAATGGSFKESLLAGATSYAGSQIGSAIGNTLESSGQAAINTAGAKAGLTAGTAGDLGVAAQQVGAGAAAPSFVERALGSIPGADVLGTSIAGAVPGASDLLGTAADKTIGQAVGQVAGQVGTQQATEEAGVTSQIEPFPTDPVARLDEQQIQQQLDEIANQIITGASPTGLPEDEFDALIRGGLTSRAGGLGDSPTVDEFSALFGDIPTVGNEIVRPELRSRVGDVFDDSRISGNQFFNPDTFDFASILDAPQQRAQEEVANFAARGNLNPTGGRNAQQFIQNARRESEEDLTDLARTQAEAADFTFDTDFRTRRDEALGRADTFDLFGDSTPFNFDTLASTEDTLASDRVTQFNREVDRLFNSQPNPFDVREAINVGGATGGLTSGRPANQESILDVIASRERRRDPRGLSTNRQSGRF